MRSSIMKLLLSFVLSVAVWSCAMANKVTIEDVKSEVPENDYISSFKFSLENNLLSAKLVLKEDSKGPIEMQMNIHQDGALIRFGAKSINDPQAINEEQNLCRATESLGPDDELYSMATGEYELEGCDLASSLSDIEPGNYEVEVTFLQDNAELTSFTMQVKVEKE